MYLKLLYIFTSLHHWIQYLSFLVSEQNKIKVRSSNYKRDYDLKQCLGSGSVISQHFGFMDPDPRGGKNIYQKTFSSQPLNFNC